MPDLRDVGVGAIVAAAGGLAWALVKSAGWLLGPACQNCAAIGLGVGTMGAKACAATAATAGPVFLGLRGWQWLNIGAFAVNVASVSVPGRIDGQMAEQAKKQKMAKASKEGGGSSSKKDALGRKDAAGGGDVAGVPRDSMYRSLVTPAGWAFAIWGVIFTTEAIFTAAQALPASSPSSLSPEAAAVYASVAPWWAMACGLQALWCAAFRDWARAPRHFWLSGAILAAEAAALGGAHRVLRVAVAEGMVSTGAYLACHLPVSLHFGWITAAAVVNANSLVAVVAPPPHVQLSFAFASVWGAAALGALVTANTGDPLFAGVLAWALSAVAADGGRRVKETLGEVPLAALTHSAATAARALAGLGVVVAGARALGMMAA